MELYGLPSILNSAEISQEIFPKRVFMLQGVSLDVRETPTV